MLADLSRAARMQFGAGMTTRSGEQILSPEEIGNWNAIIRALGASSVKEADYYDATKALKTVETTTSERKGRIGNQFKAALRDGDMEDVPQAIEEFNADHPRNRITVKDALRWRRDAARAQRQRDETGVLFDPKRNQGREELLGFAR